MRDRNQARLGSEQLFILGQKNLPGVVDGRNAQPGALFRAEHLPGNDVGVMLQPGDDDLIVLLNIAPAPTLRHQVDAFGGSSDEYDLARGSGIEKTARLLARGLVGIGRARG